MAKSLTTRLALIGAVLAFPAAALAQDVPDAPDPEVDDVRTGTRLPMIHVIGAIRDPRAGPEAEAPADTAVPELPVVYEDGPAPAPKR